MKKLLVLLAAVCFSVCSSGCNSSSSSIEARSILLGDEQFDEYVPLLEGKRVALFSNHSGIVGDKISGDRDFDPDARFTNNICGEHVLDAMLEHGVNVVAIFCPEHGFRGTEDAGSQIDDSVDEKTGIPILSLYANNTHSPSEEDMQKFDVLVVDIQDVGLRYYTYYVSMYYLMNACASHNKGVIILDRPNPNGFYVDGNILVKGYESGVGRLPIPTVHGLTLGELALMINGEGWLSTGKNSCNLKAIPCKNYTHETKYSLIRNPSPNIKTMRAVYLYASTCFFENTVVSVGRGTNYPFEIYGSPYLKNVEGFEFTFTPQSMSGATNPPFMNEVCYGKDLRDELIQDIFDNGINLEYLVDAYNSYKKTSAKNYFWGSANKNGRYWIDLLSGSDKLRKMIEAGKSASEIKESWQSDIQAFKTQRKPYLLYEE